MVKVSLIRTEADYKQALARVYELMTDLSPHDGQIEDLDHPSRIELDVLAPMVLEYEDEHYPIDPPTDPIASIEFCMDQQNLTLALHKHLGISAETLLQPVISEFDVKPDLS